jgi:hypothetical protein
LLNPSFKFALDRLGWGLEVVPKCGRNVEQLVRALLIVTQDSRPSLGNGHIDSRLRCDVLSVAVSEKFN